MKTKQTLFVTALCSCLSLVSIGFANWATVQAPASVSGSLSAEDVAAGEQFLELSPPTGLGYQSTGFITEDEGNPYKGSVLVPVTLHTEKCREVFSDTMKVAVTMRYFAGAPADADSIFLATTETGGVPRPCLSDEVTSKAEGLVIDEKTELETQAQAATIFATVSLEKASGNVEVDFRFIFELTAELFQRCFYQPMIGAGGTPMSFAFEARLEEVVP